MKPKSVAYRRVFNLGKDRYETVTLELIYEVEEGDVIDDVIQRIKDKVKEHAPKVKVSEKPDVT